MPVSFAEVARIWRALASNRTALRRSSSPGPQLEAKIRDVVGLYLDPVTSAACSARVQLFLRTRPGTVPHKYCRARPPRLRAAKPRPDPHHRQTNEGEPNSIRLLPRSVRPPRPVDKQPPLAALCVEAQHSGPLAVLTGRPVANLVVARGSRVIAMPQLSCLTLPHSAGGGIKSAERPHQILPGSSVVASQVNSAAFRATARTHSE